MSGGGAMSGLGTRGELGVDPPADLQHQHRSGSLDDIIIIIKYTCAKYLCVK